METGKKMITLYHGSKSGIRGEIAPISRERCDFGKGFYMGTDRAQPLTLICNYPKAILYTCLLYTSDADDEAYDVVLAGGGGA